VSRHFAVDQTLEAHGTSGDSQRSLAKTAGLNPLGIKRIEDGADASRLPLAIVRRIAQALGLTIDQLLAPPPTAPAADEQPLPDPGPLTYSKPDYSAASTAATTSRAASPRPTANSPSRR
jgi:transcriptional regulator with XRE-family HTH domain